MKKSRSSLFSEIEKLIGELDAHSISDERKAILRPLIDFIRVKVLYGLEIRLNFICTHNSRRSHLAQVWAQALAAHFQVNHVYCYSAGTEVTSLFPMVAETLMNSGFKVNKISEGANPVYTIKYAENAHPIIGFSKKLNDEFNPTSDFAAIVTCDSANEACPIIQGAEKRIAISFDDPKIFDSTPQQAEKYQERSLQIAQTFFYVFSEVNR